MVIIHMANGESILVFDTLKGIATKLNEAGAFLKFDLYESTLQQTRPLADEWDTIYTKLDTHAWVYHKSITWLEELPDDKS